ncbi:hypothetical protein [Novosphingobium sp. UBA1939]|uniref:hypothetical protein n=1 Tax=Novosphingobium sp. UBA1939 TaxID=1946982 RepID=UPI0025DAB67B|nr:hypothetical protein [Novosphingobium sp. UBA1939]
MDADILSKLANLPWSLQTVLGSGYVAYLLAYVGIRQHHKPVDTVFLTLAFGMIAALSIWLTPALPPAARMLNAFVATLAAGVLWRTTGRNVFRWIFRHTGYSWSDDTLSSLEHLAEYTRSKPRQLSVETDDGMFLYSTNLARFEHAAFGPYILGGNGDMLMYVDARETPDGVRTEHHWVMNDDWGDLVTWIPAHRIRSIGVRIPRPTSAAAAEAGWKAKVSGWVGLNRRHRATETAQEGG